MFVYEPSIKNHLTDPQDGFSPIHHLPITIAVLALLAWMLVIAPWIETSREAKPIRQSAGRDRRPARSAKNLLKWSARILGLALVATFLTLPEPYAIWLFTQARYGLPILTLLSGLGVAVVATALVRRAINRIAGPFADRALILGLAILGPLTLWFVFLLLSSWALSPPVVVFDFLDNFRDYRGAQFHPTVLIAHLSSPPRVATPDFTEMALVIYAGTGILLLFVFIAMYDVNAASIHTFYRDKLSKAFLFTYEDDAAFSDTQPTLE